MSEIIQAANSVVGNVLSRLENVRETGDAQWSARCPAHDDQRNSLCVSAADDGTLLLKCQAGCNTQDVLRAKGLELRDLFPRMNGHNGHAANGKPNIVATYDYRDEQGELIFQVVRFEPKDFRQRRPDGNGGWIWNVKGVRTVPYRLPELLANPDEIVFVVEGEKDVDNLTAIGIVATCNAGGAGKWRSEHAEFLRGRDIVILPDNDEPGRKHAQQVAQSLAGIAQSVKVVELPGLPAKGDVSDWLASGGSKDELRRIVAAAEQDETDATGPIPFGRLADENPEQDEPIIDGLLRRHETANLISGSKVGKSWLSYALAMSVIDGRQFLGRFQCLQGPVLLIDNELRRGAIRHRLQTVATTMGIPEADLRLSLDVWSLRGRLVDLVAILKQLERVEPRRYQLIILDAWYRSLPIGTSENDNAQIMQLYNAIDQAAERLQCAWVNIHHSSKGQQGEKSVTDVGAGAGSQSRCVDAHIVFRQHEEPDCVVLDAALRSFKPIDPVPMRWQYPLWMVDDSLDPTRLKGKLTASEQRQGERDSDGVLKLAEVFKEQGRCSKSKLRGRTGLSKGRCDRLLDQLEAKGSVRWTEEVVEGNKCRVYEAIDLRLFGGSQDEF